MATPYASQLGMIAEDQYNKYHLQHEHDSELSKQIRAYWKGISLTFPGVTTPWSAVFVSWCVKTAGATVREFRLSDRHSTFVHWAIQNKENETGLFRAYRITEYAPKVGDIIQNNRNGHNFDYDHAKSDDSYESHSAIVIETGDDSQGKYALTVGGNETDSVGMKIVRLHSDGKIRQRSNSSFISVIQNLK